MILTLLGWYLGGSLLAFLIFWVCCCASARGDQMLSVSTRNIRGCHAGTAH